MPRLMGWRKDRYDARDYLHVKLAPPVVPDCYSLADFAPQVRDQGHVGSCVGFGLGGNLTGLARKLGVYLEWFSPTWIYNGARFMDGSLLTDAGAYPRDGLEWLRRKGALLEHFWPYDPDHLDKTSPPSSLDPEAAKWPLVEYYRVADGVDGICSAIASGYFVSIGTPWFSAWMDAPADGVLPEVTTSSGVAGGHETVLYGYDRLAKVFFGLNSWGKDWGAGGAYTMPFSAFQVFKLLGGYDAHYIDVTWSSSEPPPPPVKKPWYVRFWEWLKRLLGL